MFRTLLDAIPSMDFKGQQLAERIYQSTILLFAVIGFVVGFKLQDFSLTFYILSAGTTLAGLLVIPPWPFYRRHPVTFLPPKDTAASASPTSTASTSGTDSTKKKQ